PPYVICHDRTLAELAEAQPRSLDALSGITGLGKTKIQRYGEALVATIKGFAGKDDGTSASSTDTDAPAPQDAPASGSSTRDATCALLRAGKDVAQIAETRGLTEGTIYGHCASLIEQGEVTLDEIADIDPADLDAIHGAFERCGTLESGEVGPAFAALDKRFPHGLLKCVLAEIA
ncbi:MAG: helix-turn-helix domain-containing protein, partial [Pseudomonadota bacterium]